MTERHFPSPDTTLTARGSTYRIAVLRGAELETVLPLFRDAFNRDFTLDWLRRKYACEREGLAGFACVALTEQGDAAGSVGLLPWAMRLGQRSEIAGQMVDVATGSAHRGRGLFVQLAEIVGELCSQAGVGFLYGFPNEEAYPIWTQKLGYAHIDNLLQYRLPVRTVWAERVARRASPLNRVYEPYVRRVLAGYRPAASLLENSLLAEGFAGVDRDGPFHAYKSSFAGSRVVALAGGRVWLNVRHGLLVGDLEASTEADLDTTAHALERLAVRLGVHHVVFQASTDTRFSSLARRFDVSPGLPVIYRDLGSRIPIEKLRFTFGDFDNF